MPLQKISHCSATSSSPRNPIELAWSLVKGYVAKHNKGFTLKEVEKLVPEGINMVTPALWEKFCRHTEKVEDEYWHKDGLIEDIVEEILINVEDDDSSDTSGSDSDDVLGADSDHLHSNLPL